MNDKTNYLDFAKISLATYNLNSFEIDNSTALKWIEKEIADELLDLNATKTKKLRFKTLKVAKTKPTDYTERIIDIDSKRKIICGIRHMNGNPQYPFVNIQSNFSSSKSELTRLYKKHLLKYFKVFQPKYLRYYSKNKIDSNKISACYLGQQASVIKKRKAQSKESKLMLLTPLPACYYDWYLEGYKNFHEKHPEHKLNVPCSSKKDMDTCLEQGLLKMVAYDGKRIGLIAAQREAFLGMPGICFYEIFITEKYKGKGLAKSIQRKFIAEVAKENEFVWGTIEYSNTPSLKTALSNGRVIMRFENFAAI